MKTRLQEIDEYADKLRADLEKDFTPRSMTYYPYITALMGRIKEAVALERNDQADPWFDVYLNYPEHLTAKMKAFTERLS